MISKAVVHKATVLMNRRMNTERRVTTFGPVCSSVAGMSCIISEEGALRKRGAHPCCNEGATLSRVVIWSSLINLAMDFVRDERIIGKSNRSSADCPPKSKMGGGSGEVAGFTECVAECNFDCRHVRVYRGGHGVSPDFR